MTADDRGAFAMDDDGHVRDYRMLEDDRGAAALAERLADVLERPEDWTQETAAILGERGRFLPDGDEDDLLVRQEARGMMSVELARLRRIEAARGAALARCDEYEASARAAGVWRDTDVDAVIIAGVRAALEAEA